MKSNVKGKDPEIGPQALFSRKYAEAFVGFVVLSIIGISVYFAFLSTDLKPEGGIKSLLSLLLLMGWW